MDWDAIGAIGELVGAIATVATLIYLSLQIRANTLVTKRQALDDIIERIIRWEHRLSASPDHLRCWVQGSRGFVELSIEDRVQFTALINEILASIEALMEAAKTEHVKPDTVEAAREAVLQLFRNKGVREYWQQALMAGDFMREIEELSRKASDIPEGTPGNLPYYIPPT